VEGKTKGPSKVSCWGLEKCLGCHCHGGSRKDKHIPGTFRRDKALSSRRTMGGQVFAFERVGVRGASVGLGVLLGLVGENPSVNHRVTKFRKTPSVERRT